MEASEAAVEQAAPEETAEVEAQTDTQPDVGSRMDELMDRFNRWEERQEQQQQMLGQPQSQYQQQYQDDELSSEQQQALEGDYVQQMMREAAEQVLAPYIERQEEQRRTEEIEMLEDAYAELKDGRVARGVVQAADTAARKFGMPQLAGEPGFVELVYKARKADQRAADEQPAGTQPPEAQLERSGGVAPPPPEEDEA